MKKNRKLKKEFKLFITIASVLMLIFISVKTITYINNESLKNNKDSIHIENNKDAKVNKEIVSIPENINDNDIIKYLKEFQHRAEKDERYNDVIKKYKEYPKDILNLLYRNDETIDFVLSKSEFKIPNLFIKIDQQCGNGVIPKLQQWDPKWGYFKYGNNVLAINGCGPTAVSMVASGLTGNKGITPIKVAKYSDSNGFHEVSGTSWNLMSDGVKKFGIKGWKIDNTKEEFVKALENKNPIICSVGPGFFTQEGHFMVISGIKDGKLIIHDPNSINRSEKLWRYEDIYKQIKSAWAYSKD